MVGETLGPYPFGTSSLFPWVEAQRLQTPLQHAIWAAKPGGTAHGLAAYWCQCGDLFLNP